MCIKIRFIRLYVGGNIVKIDTRNPSKTKTSLEQTCLICFIDITFVPPLFDTNISTAFKVYQHASQVDTTFKGSRTLFFYLM